MNAVMRGMAALLGAATVGIAASAEAAQFGQQEVSADRFAIVAAPAGRISHQLLILEQLSNQRPCWQESGSNPVIIDPLLLQFDFTNICNRSTDSNGYSVRVGGEDLALQYSLRVQRSANDLVLMAVPARDPNAPSLEIGRVDGITEGFARINLNSGWRLTRRTYNGQPLGHLYLTNDQDFATLTGGQSTPIAAAPTPATPPTVRPLPLPPRPTPPIVSRPTTPLPPLPRVPDSRIVVVLDPGHGGSDPGAVGVGGLSEVDVVMPVSQAIADRLEAQGVAVVMTRTRDVDVELEPRVAIAEQSNADVFVSIHANSAGASSASGTETYYYSNGSALAQAIQRHLIQATGMDDRGVKQANFYVLRNTSMPAVLVELGFVSNAGDASRLGSAAVQTQMAEAIARGILEYLQ